MSANQQIELQEKKHREDQHIITINDDQNQSKRIEYDEKCQLQEVKSLNAEDFIDVKENKSLTCYESILNCCGNVFGTLRAWLPCCFFCCPYPYFQNEFGNIALVEKFGKLFSVLGDGMHKINPMTDKYKIVNMKTQIIDLAQQVILTNDNVTIYTDAVVYYRIFDALRCEYRLVNYKQSVSEITLAALRAVCGEYKLQQILEEREKISQELEKFVFDQVKNWGIYIEQAFIKDIKLSSDLQVNLSSVAKSRRLGEAKVISADADVKSAKLLREAANLLDSSAAMQIRYFEQIQQIAKEPTQKVLFLPFGAKECM